MEASVIWWIIFGGMIVTYATRLSFTVLLPAERLPSSLRKGLRFAPPSVLAAIAVPEIILAGPHNALAPTSPETLAGLLAGLIAWRTSNTWLTIALGMVALWLLQSIGL